jgi:hypothetical protein
MQRAMKRGGAWALLLALTLAPAAGRAADARLGIATAMGWDSNVFRVERDEEDDWIFSVTPKLKFLEDEGKFTWDLGYDPTWEKAIQTDQVKGFRHFAYARSRYQLSGRTQVFFEDGFYYSDTVNASFVEDDVTTSPDVNTFRDNVLRNDLTLGVQHSFTPRLEGSLAFSNQLFRSDLETRADNEVYRGNANLQYTLTPQHQVGGGAAFTWQHFQATDNDLRPGSRTVFFNVFGSWSWFIDEKTTFSVTAGPTFIDDDQDAPETVIAGAPRVPFVDEGATIRVFDINSCDTSGGDRVLELCSSSFSIPSASPDAVDIRADGSSQTLTFPAGQAPEGASENRWTLFGEVSLTRRWTPNLQSSLSYQRTDDTASGIAGSSILDWVSLVNLWQISELWRADLRADFTRRKSATESDRTLIVVVPSGINPLYAETQRLTSTTVKEVLETNRWGVSTRVTRQITRHLQASVRYAFNRQSSKARTAGRRSDFDDHLVTFGVQYDFDRWRLW